MDAATDSLTCRDESAHLEDSIAQNWPIGVRIGG